MPTAAPSPRSRAPALLPALLVTTLLLGVGTAEAHPHNTTPPVDVTIVIRGPEVTALLDVEKMLLSRDVAATVPDDAAFAWLREHLEVAIDGAVAEPVLRSFLEAPFDTTVKSPHVKVSVAYPTTRRPTSLRVTWKDFFGIVWEGAAQLPLLIEADLHVDSVTLAKHEPEYVWHRKPPAAFRTSGAPQAQPAAPGTIPLAALALGALALLLPFVGPWRRRAGIARWAPSGVALGAGAAVFLAGLGTIRTPWGHAVPPTEAQARTILTSLLHNVYRAMDVRTENQAVDAKVEKEIYALLEASVERPILDGLYGDIYESLVLRDQGGVVARVEDVSVADVAIAYPADESATQFTATATWQLKAAVSHLGHTHKRQNLYRADILLRHDGSAWRMASITMLERKRLDDGRGGLLDTPKDIPAPGRADERAGLPPAAPGQGAEKPR